MKVILIQDVGGLGKKFDVKNIKDGYARNFLLPKNLAKIATDKTIKELEAQKAVWQRQESEEKIELEALAKDLEKQEFKFALKVGEKGGIFGSVTKDDIKNKLPTPDVNIDLGRPIKKLGEHQVEINLSHGIKAKIKVIIEPQQA